MCSCVMSPRRCLIRMHCMFDLDNIFQFIPNLWFESTSKKTCRIQWPDFGCMECDGNESFYLPAPQKNPGLNGHSFYRNVSRPEFADNKPRPLVCLRTHSIFACQYAMVAKQAPLSIGVSGSVAKKSAEDVLNEPLIDNTQVATFSPSILVGEPTFS